MSDVLGDTPVVVLAGGLGTRLRPVVDDRPKALAPVGDKPFLEILVELLRGQGARRFVFCVGHRAGQVVDRFGDGSRLGVTVEYSVEQGQLLGTAGALKLAERYFAPRALVLNGDTFFATDYAGLVGRHLSLRRSAAVIGTVALARAADAARFGSVLLDEGGRFVTGFLEKTAAPPASAGGWLNAGAYVIERELLDLVPGGGPCSLERDVFPGVSGGRRLGAAACPDEFFDIGTPAALAGFCDRYRAHLAAERPEAA